MTYGEKIWDQLFLNWKKWKEDGLTEHRNWWPNVYRAACRYWQVDPDPKLLSYSISYEELRPDLKKVIS